MVFILLILSYKKGIWIQTCKVINETVIFFHFNDIGKATNGNQGVLYAFSNLIGAR